MRDLKNVLAFPQGVVKKVLGILKMCWHSHKEWLKSVGDLRNVFAFPKGAVNPNQDDQGRKRPRCLQRLITLKCLNCEKIEKNI